MSHQYLREAKLRIAGKEFVTRITFEIRKGERDSGTVGAKPNKASISLFNISADSRRAIENHAAHNAALPKNKDALLNAMVLEAGYKGLSSVIFVGDISSVETRRIGPDLETRIDAGDGERRLIDAHVDFSMDGDNVTDRMILEKAVEAIGLDRGFNSSDLPNTPRNNGFAYAGSAADLIDQIAKKNGLAWSVQNGVLRIRPETKPTTPTAILLNERTGLIGYPSKTMEGYRVECLLNPEIEPGRLVTIQSAVFPDIPTFVVKNVEHVGDTHGDRWSTTIWGMQI